MTRLARFKQLCAPERMSFSKDGMDCVVTVEWLHAAGEVPTSLTDATFVSIVELGRRGTGARLVPRRVEFTRPDDGGGVHRDYFGCPIRFGAGRNALVLDAADLDRPFPGHNPELLDILNPALASALSELEARSSTGEQVKIMLKRILASGRPEIADVARELGLSERTLQRRITGEGKTFRQLLVEARQDLVRQLLQDPSVEISEVAFLLGYEDANSFYRAFRSWEGTTPAQWRGLRS
ncbi:AraC family transcriptional regulator [Azospirillum sp. TSO35-2]|uniref:helix-turn-helix domain-containing protein n=1 Tax=Azospirillum sp. TSO35-2 TaxID=716796 RepID=UPI000D654F90|nr:AraC family transcriptional regulator [Azospirillum sp. TSO35-2]